MAQNLLANLAGLYYQQLAKQLNNPNGFQVATGSTQVMDQPTLNSVADSIPLQSLNNSFSGNPVNTFKGNYGNVLNGLVSPSYVSNALGTAYASSWQQYQSQNSASLDFSSPDKLLSSQQALMRKWGVIDQIPSGTVEAGVTALTQEIDNPVSVAVALWHSNNGNPYGFTPPSANVAIAFNNPSPCSFQISNLENSADLSNTWAKGAFGFLFDIFELGNETSYSKESQTFVSSGFNLNFSCRQVSIDVGPVAVGQGFNVAGVNYGAWYSSDALLRAFTSPNDATVWSRSADWNKYFGGSGTFNRVVTKLFLADNINLTMSSTATFSSEEVTKLQTAAEGGFWPFFVAEGSGGSTTTVTHNNDNTITVKTSSPIGVYILLGVATASMNELMGQGN